MDQTLWAMMLILLIILLQTEDQQSIHSESFFLIWTILGRSWLLERSRKEDILHRMSLKEFRISRSQSGREVKQNGRPQPADRQQQVTFNAGYLAAYIKHKNCALFGFWLLCILLWLWVECEWGSCLNVWHSGGLWCTRSDCMCQVGSEARIHARIMHCFLMKLFQDFHTFCLYLFVRGDVAVNLFKLLALLDYLNFKYWPKRLFVLCLGFYLIRSNVFWILVIHLPFRLTYICYGIIISYAAHLSCVAVQVLSKVLSTALNLNAFWVGLVFCDGQTFLSN